MYNHLLVMVLAEYSSSYSLFACHTMLATTSILTLLKLATFPNHCELTHAHPTMSCIHLVYDSLLC